MGKALLLLAGLVIGLAAGFLIGRTFPAPEAITELELSVVAPGDSSEQAVLRYQGSDTITALKANVSTMTSRLNQVVAVDPKDPKSGVVRWTGFGLRTVEDRGGMAGNSAWFGRGSEIELRVVRIDQGGMKWELSEESVRRVADELRRPR